MYTCPSEITLLSYVVLSSTALHKKTICANSELRSNLNPCTPVPFVLRLLENKVLTLSMRQFICSRTCAYIVADLEMVVVLTSTIYINMARRLSFCFPSASQFQALKNVEIRSSVQRKAIVYLTVFIQRDRGITGFRVPTGPGL